MEGFDYVMMLVSIIIGLALTHIMSNLAQAIPALAKREKTLRLHPAFLCWCGFVFLYLVSFWWFEYEWSRVKSPWDFDRYLLLVTYATLLYVLAVALVPARLEALCESFDHFLAVRRWFFAVLLTAAGVDVIDSLAKGIGWGTDLDYWAYQATLVVICGVGWRTTAPRTHTLMAVLLLVWQLAFMFGELGVLGIPFTRG